MKNLIYIAILFIFLSCLNGKKQQKDNESGDTICLKSDSLRINELMKFIGQNMNDMLAVDGCRIEKIILEGDEGVEWDGINYYIDNDLIFVVESNWVDRNKVNRITIYSDYIKEGDLYVGQEIKKIRNAILEDIPSGPDGYLFVKLKNNLKITLQLDITNIPVNSPLYYGVSKLSDIPDSLKVESIILME